MVISKFKCQIGIIISDPLKSPVLEYDPGAVFVPFPQITILFIGGRKHQDPHPFRLLSALSGHISVIITI